MKMFKQKILVLSMLIFCSTYAISDDNSGPLSGMPAEVIDFALNFVENPGDLFFSLEQSMEDVSPLNKKWFGIRTNIFPTLLPFTLGNLSFKVRFNNETKNFPQIGIAAGYGKILALDMMPREKDTPVPENVNYYYGMTLSKTFEEKATVYLGAKYSQALLSVKLSSPVAIIGESKLSEINFKIDDVFYFTGITIKTSPKRTVVAQMAYGPKYKKIVARVGVEGPSVEFGLDIFPEGLLVLYPYWAYHWRF
ncbi:MAG: hypothetical protein SNJ64_04230 [Endomicrobiia bacterium]